MRGRAALADRESHLLVTPHRINGVLDYVHWTVENPHPQNSWGFRVPVYCLNHSHGGQNMKTKVTNPSHQPETV